MKKFYIVILFTILVFTGHNLFSETISQVSSTCVDSLLVYDHDDTGKKQMADTNELENNDIFILTISIPDVDSIMFYLDVNSEFDPDSIIQAVDELRIYQGNVIHEDSIVYDNESIEVSSDKSITIIGDTAIVVFENRGNNSIGSYFKLFWEGKISASIDELTHNCTPGGSDGIIEIPSNSGAAPFLYEWDNGVTEKSNKITDLEDGDYTYTITDNSGCTVSEMVEIKDPPTSALSVVPTDLKHACYGSDEGKVTLDVTGGYPDAALAYNYNIEWHDGNTEITRSNLFAGTYSYTVTDTAGCYVTGNVIINQPTSPLKATLVINDSISCNSLNNGGLNSSDGLIKVTMSEGYHSGGSNYMYDWNDTSTVYTNSLAEVSNLGDGSYFVTVTDDSSCVAVSNTVVLAEPDELTATIEVTNDVSCVSTQGTHDNGEITASVLGGTSPYSYDWDNAGSFTDDDYIYENLEVGSHECDVHDAKGCKVENIGVTIDDVIEIEATYEDSSDYNGWGISCYNGDDGFLDIQVTSGPVSANYTYVWSANASGQTSDRIEDLGEGTYSYTITDENNCVETGDYTLSAPPELIITGVHTDATGYGVSDGSIAIDPISDAVGIYVQDWTGNDTDDASLDQTGLEAGHYELTIIDSNLCTASEDFDISQPSITDGGEIKLWKTDSIYYCHYAQGTKTFNSVAQGFDSTSVSYVWQYSDDNEDWDDVASMGTTIDADFNASDTVTQSFYIRRQAKKDDGYAYTDAIFIEYIAEQNLTIFNLNDEYCEDDDSVLIVVSPYIGDGVFSGTRIFDNSDGTAYFKLDSLDSPFITSDTSEVLYTYTHPSSSCTTKVVDSAIVNPLPDPKFTIRDVLVDTESEVEIKDIDPDPTLSVGTGFISGEGVIYDGDDYYFTPETVGEGEYTITYSYTDEKGCSNDTVKTVKVLKGAGSIVANDDILLNEFCIYGDSVEIQANIPGIDINEPMYFDPDTIRTLQDTIGYFLPADWVGNNTITFHCTDTNGAVLTNTFEFDVFDVVDKAVILDLDEYYCQVTTEDTIIRVESLGGDGSCNYTLTRGTTSYDLTDVGDNWAEFDIKNLDTTKFGSVPYTISTLYTHENTTSNCTDADTQEFFLYGLDSVDFDLKNIFNLYEDPVEILNIHPVDATLSGGGIVSTNYFDPDLANEGSSEINATYYNSNTKCTTYADSIVTVEVPQGSIEGNDEIYCFNGVADTITVSGITNGRSGGTFSIEGFTLSSADTIGSDTLIIYPSKYGKDENHTILYTYKHNVVEETEFTISANFYNDDVGVLGFRGLDTVYCEYNDVVQITGTVNSVNAYRGVLSDTEGLVTATGDVTGTGSGTADFNPDEIAVDSIFTDVSFIYESEYLNSSCKDTVIEQVTIYNTPVITFTDSLLSIYNTEGENHTLKALPEGGVFSGECIENNIGIFNPSITTASSTTTITYNYTDEETNCFNSESLSTILVEPEGTIDSVLDLYCYNDGFETVGVSGLNVNSIEGVFSGVGVTDIGDGEWADLSTKVVHDSISNNETEVESEVTYTYKMVEGNDTAIFEIVKSFIVNNSTNVSFNIPSKDTVRCSGGESVDLSTTTAGDIGVFTLLDNVLIGDIFTPEDANIGENVIYFNYASGICTIKRTDTITVYGLPDPSFSLVTQLCINDEIVLVGEPRGGVFTGSSLVNLDSQKDSVLLTVSTLGDETYTYTYEDENSCSASDVKNVTVNSNPELEISDNFTGQYCINGESSEFFIKDGGNQISSGLFCGDSVNDLSDDGLYQFNPAVYQAGSYTLGFSFTNVNNCSDKDSVTFVINDLPLVDIFGIDTLAYCPYNDNKIISISGSPAAVYGTGSNDGLKVNEILYSVGKVDFIPYDYIDTSQVEFIYTFTDDVGCENTTSKTVKINSLPEVDFVLDNYCIGEETKFTYSVESFDIDSIESFSWDFGDGGELSTEQDPLYNYTEVGDKLVSLTVKNIDGCSITKEELFSFDEGPVANFGWDFECSGTEVTFTNLTTKTVGEYVWEIEGEEFSNELNPSYSFNEVGQYSITLRTIESDKCKDDTSKIISIRPIFSVNAQEDYEDGFETEYSGWASEILDGDSAFLSWERASPNGQVIQGSVSAAAWVTNANGNYHNYESSAVTSPCFDLTELARPMISFDYSMNLENENDGVVLQYMEVGNGEWQNLGSVNDGVDWFNYRFVSSNPGAGDNQEGWTGESEGWLSAMHDLDDLMDIEGLVRFRVAFASGLENNEEGFAFDNFKIAERPKRVLVEHFTNTETSSSSDAVINSMVGQNPLDIIDIQYHTSSPAGDQLYNEYPTGPNVRTIYYNLSEVPYSLVNGQENVDYSSSSDDRQNLVLNASMESPVFDISIVTEKTGNTIKIENTVEALMATEERQLQIISAIVEKEVVLSDSNIVYENVLRKLLPSASGEYIESEWNVGDNRLYTFTYEIDDYVTNSENINVVTFIQDEVSHEILQVQTTDTTSVVTALAIDELFSNSSKLDMIIYPNPASSNVHVLLSEVAGENNLIQILDQQGKVVLVEEFVNGVQQKLIDVDHLQEGIYLVNYFNGNTKVVRKLVLIK